MKNMILGFASIVFCFSACGDEKGSADSNRETPDGIQTALLPAGSETMNCVEPPNAPALCDWAGALDGLYFGDVSKLEMVDFPAVLATDSDTVVSTCPSGIINQALEITIIVSDTLLGTLSPGAEMTFVLGHHQLDETDLRPLIHPKEGIVWGTLEAGIRVGDRIGVPIHKSKTGRFGLLGEPLLTQKVDGSVVAQGRAKCQEPVAEGLVNKSLADIEAEITSCSPGQEAQDRRTDFEKHWEQNKTWAYAALCFPESASTTGCGVDADCPIGKTCNSSGSCE